MWQAGLAQRVDLPVVAARADKASGNYDNIYIYINIYIYKTGAIKFMILAFILLKNNVKKPVRPINCYFTANYILLLQDGLPHHHNIQEL